MVRVQADSKRKSAYFSHSFVSSAVAAQWDTGVSSSAAVLQIQNSHLVMKPVWWQKNSQTCRLCGSATGLTAVSGPRGSQWISVHVFVQLDCFVCDWIAVRHKKMFVLAAVAPFHARGSHVGFCS